MRVFAWAGREPGKVEASMEGREKTRATPSMDPEASQDSVEGVAAVGGSQETEVTPPEAAPMETVCRRDCDDEKIRKRES